MRIEGAGFWCHVMCRGNAGRHVFHDNEDRQNFLNRLGTVAGTFHKVRVEDMEKTGRGCGRNEARQVAIWLV